MFRLIIRPGFLLTSALAVLLDTQGLFWCYFLAAAVHEAAHMAGVRLTGGRVRALELGAAGARLHYDVPLSYRAEMAVALAGAAGNAAAALLASAAGAAGAGRGWYLFAGANVLLAVFNLLPVAALDGGQFLYACVALRKDEAAARRVTRAASFVFCALFLAAGLYILLQTRYNTTMLLLGLYLTACTIKPGLSGGGDTARRALTKGM